MSRPEPFRDGGQPALLSFVVVSPLAPLGDGAEFGADAWPSHVTLVPPFVSRAQASETAQSVLDACRGIRPITTVAMDRERFGRHGRVSVVTLRPVPELVRLHATLLSAAALLAVEPFDPRHVLSGFRPHVSRVHGTGPEPGEPVTLDSVALVSRGTGAERGLRRVARLISLTS